MQRENWEFETHRRIRPTRVFERAGESRMTPPASSISSQDMRWLLETIGYVPRAEVEARYYEQAAVAGIN